MSTEHCPVSTIMPPNGKTIFCPEKPTVYCRRTTGVLCLEHSKRHFTKGYGCVPADHVAHREGQRHQ